MGVANGDRCALHCGGRVGLVGGGDGVAETLDFLGEVACRMAAGSLTVSVSTDSVSSMPSVWLMSKTETMRNRIRVSSVSFCSAWLSWPEVVLSCSA